MWTFANICERMRMMMDRKVKKFIITHKKASIPALTVEFDVL